MTGRQLLYAYDMNLDTTDIEIIKHYAGAIRSLTTMCKHCSEWIAMWRLILLRQHPDVRFNRPISPPKTRRFTIWTSTRSESSSSCS